ncbi:hypothetical protein ABMA75_15390 [Halobacteriovorax sp. ZH4_bin.1]|uniref:hypothetical protein n=1 Tax=unclassified Halobacteriovorax TaxID=2639665 RepID=UPI00371EB680
MRSIFLIPIILLLSCGKPNESAYVDQNFNPSFKGQSLIATQIQCQSIKTNFSSEKNSCPTTFINEEKLFLFSIDQEDIDFNTVNGFSLITLRISTNVDLQARFYLVSKYGKRLSETVFFDGKSDLIFKEKNVGDFLAHEVYLKLEDYYTGGVKPISVRDEDNQNCDTGLFNVEDVNIEDLRGQCPNLKIITNLKAIVNAPVYNENSGFNMENVDYYIPPTRGKNPFNGKSYTIPAPLFRLNYRIFKYMSEQELEVNRFYNIVSDEFGLDIKELDNEVCAEEGILEIQSYSELKKKWMTLDDQSARKQSFQTIHINGEYIDFKSNYKVKRCYSVKPKLSGYILIKE